MDWLQDALFWVFRYFLYPAIILLVVTVLVSIVVNSVQQARSNDGWLRRLIAALMPVVALILVIAIPSELNQGMEAAMDDTSFWFRFFLGVAIAVLILEFAKLALWIHHDVTWSLFILFVSALACLVLWAVITEVLQSLTVVLIGFTVGGGFHVIFRGPPI